MIAVQEQMFTGLYPVASSLRVGDVVEGSDGKAYPRPWKVVAVNVAPDGRHIEVGYRETGGKRTEGIRVLRINHPVDLQPPF